MILPRGITGFDVPKGHIGPDPGEFRAHCWQVVAPRGGRLDPRPQVLAGSITNFITQVLVLPTGAVTVLLNAIYPWIGCCRPLEPGNCSLEFVGADPVRASLEAIGRYRVLSPAELEQRVTEAMCAGLGSAERHQLKYWSKLGGGLRVGDVVFNFWD